MKITLGVHRYSYNDNEYEFFLESVIVIGFTYFRISGYAIKDDIIGWKQISLDIVYIKSISSRNILSPEYVTFVELFRSDAVQKILVML